MAAFLVLTPPHRCNAQLAIAAARAGEIGVVDLGFTADSSAHVSAVHALSRYAGANGRNWGVRWDAWGQATRGLRALSDLPESPWPLLVLAGFPCEQDVLREVLRAARQHAQEVYLEVCTLSQAFDAEMAGFDGTLVKGNEAGGRVGQESSFILLQRMHRRLRIPYFIQGGMAPETASAAFLAGAAGVVLCEQVWLAAESPFDSAERRTWTGLDGSETSVIGDADWTYRFFSRSARTSLLELERTCAEGNDWHGAFRERFLVNAKNSAHDSALDAGLVPLSPDVAFAERLADENRNVAGILDAFKRRVEENLRQAVADTALAPNAPLAVVLGTQFPILQGPMTRVSDVAAFSRDVAENGALPFLALALMRGEEVRELLLDVKALLGERAWGVGILGFVPAELRKEQLEVIREIRPPFTIIAGGRPSLARQLEERGISTFLHVPSPGLLQAFIHEGCRKFVLEGRECGGHVGPRSSFVLWQSAVDVLKSVNVGRNDEFEIIFAGGIHDGLSAAMVAALAAPLTARRMKSGVLMGTAYLFMHEAVTSGAILDGFQRQAVECRETVLLKTGIGHETRCTRSPFAEEFDRTRISLVRAGKSPEEVRLELEQLNLGRLRIAAKGLTRRPASSNGNQKGEIFRTDPADQLRRGMYMIGQVATLRDTVVSMIELHRDVSEGGTRTLERFAPGKLAWRRSTRPASPKRSRTATRGARDIAIVGLAGMFPKAPDVRRFWENIVRRVNAIEDVPRDRWPVELFFTEGGPQRDRVYSKWGAFLSPCLFDPMKWLIPPASLPSIDPTQLLALEVAWEAIVDAGYDRRRFGRNRVGVVFASAGASELELDYSFRTMLQRYLPEVKGLPRETCQQIVDQLNRILPEWSEDSFAGFLRNVISGRISNRLDLGGPNYVVDAACASSLTAVHSAVEHLRSGAADAMIVGAADVTNHPLCYMSFAQTRALSASGGPRPFDQSADGIGLGEGVVAVVLKRLGDAERDGDKIYAVIKGIGASSDGKARSLTSPDPPGQIAALQRAYADAGIRPMDVSLIEAHATGTAVGDAAEITSLDRFFSVGGRARRRTAIGSVKSMIGHTKSAAGLASLVKTALALDQRVLPATIGVEQPNSKLDDKHSPLYVNSETRPWFAEPGGRPRCAGVNSFGFGGTNFHVVLEEYAGAFHPGQELDLTPRAAEIGFWNRDTRDEILQELRQLQTQLNEVTTDDLAQLAYSICRNARNVGATGRSCRLSVVASSVADLREKIGNVLAMAPDAVRPVDASGIYYSEHSSLDPSTVCFLYPGQGSQAIDMFRDLVVSSRWSHALLARLDDEFQREFSKPLTQFVYPPPAFEEEERQSHQRALNDTRVAQPALGVVEIFATRFLQRFGIQPAMAAGHSYGEFVALWAAGCLSDDELLRLSVQRGRIAAAAGGETPGAMAAVIANAAETRQALATLNLPVLLANLNAPNQTIIAGNASDVEQAVGGLLKMGLTARKIPVPGAFHTPAMRPAAEKLAVVLADVPFQAPKLPVSDNTTGTYHSGDPDNIRTRLTRHMCQPVLFEQQIRRLHEDGARVFLEVGPGSVLTRLVKSILADDSNYVALSLEASGRDGWTQCAHLIAQVAAFGLAAKPETWFENRGLQDLTVDELLGQAREKQTPKPTDWILTPSKARPVSRPDPETSVSRQPARFATDATVRPESSHQERPMPDLKPEPALHSPLSVTGRVVPRTEHSVEDTKMSKERAITRYDQDSLIEQHERPQSPQNELLPAFQTTMAHWFELQTAQTRLLERFLDIQERLVLGSVARTGRQDSEPRMVREAATTTPAQRTQTPAVPQPPVLIPREPAAPARPKIIVPPRLPAETAVRANSAVSTPEISQSPPTREASPQNVTVPAPLAVRAVSPGAESESTASPNPANESAPVVEATHETLEAVNVPSTEDFHRDLLQAVSRRTGYSVDVLDEDTPLEAGLGIDSIKTVEIFSNLKKYHFYFRAADQDDEDVLLEFSQLKTLRAIVESYDQRRRRFLPRASQPAKTAASNGNRATRHEVERYSLMAVPATGESTGEKKNSRSAT